mmetsp:Transcript_20606/g.46743  ORF Transcript_20606/g.46743 Transcript_20606/m.46743 type:complete len:114 (-) Transcript_20606:82-423(-)
MAPKATSSARRQTKEKKKEPLQLRTDAKSSDVRQEGKGPKEGQTSAAGQHWPRRDRLRRKESEVRTLGAQSAGADQDVPETEARGKRAPPTEIVDQRTAREAGQGDSLSARAA